MNNPPSNVPAYYNFERKDLLDFVPRSCRRLLDVGCGSGRFGALVKAQLGAEVWGVEPFPGAAADARARIDRVLEAPFDETLDLPDGYFDVITFNDSLEHFADPFKPLSTAKAKLAPGGRLICCIPNVRYIENMAHVLFDLDWKYEDSGILDKTHLRFFTKKSMERTIKEAGFVVQEVTGIHSHYWRGKRIFLLKMFFGRYVADMRYRHFVVVATLQEDAKP